MRKSKWVYLLHYEMTGLRKIEEELKIETTSWLNITCSPSLSIILQKVQLYAQEHSSHLGYFLENKQISTITSSQSIVRILAREIQEKLKYCGNQLEKEHCILSNIAAICCLKNSFYNSCLSLATSMNQQEVLPFFNIASSNEARISKWISECKKEQKESNNHHYLLL
jgi:hypothetical protein